MPPALPPHVDAKALQILLALAAGPSHGYAIRQEVEARTEGAVRLWPATLYGALSDLVTHGWIEESRAPRDARHDPRRRYYALTADGRRALAAEAARLSAIARLARARLDAGASR